MVGNSLTPTANHLLVSIPERFRKREPGKQIIQIAGEDAMNELIAQIKSGGQIQIETETDTSISNLVRVGQVLAIPTQLTDQMVLCAAGNNKVRTFADITPVVEVGDTVYLDYSCLIDENEILPGIYRVSYAAVICVIEHQFNAPGPLDDVCAFLNPVGGYVLLSRVWSSDVTDYELDGAMRKVRWNAAGTLIAEYDVPPLPNEGVVAWVDAPLKGALNELHPGQRVVIAEGHAMIEAIAGESYLCVRHDYILAIRQNPFTKEFQRLPLPSHVHNASYPND
jgi:co-chaperonin GroES (HSP10)